MIATAKREQLPPPTDCRRPTGLTASDRLQGLPRQRGDDLHLALRRLTLTPTFERSATDMARSSQVGPLLNPNTIGKDQLPSRTAESKGCDSKASATAGPKSFHGTELKAFHIGAVNSFHGSVQVACDSRWKTRSRREATRSRREATRRLLVTPRSLSTLPCGQDRRASNGHREAIKEMDTTIRYKQAKVTAAESSKAWR